jgi:hypothetical protein
LILAWGYVVSYIIVRWQAFQKEGGNVFGGLIPGHLQREKMVSVQGAKKGLWAYSLKLFFIIDSNATIINIQDPVLTGIKA